MSATGTRKHGGAKTATLETVTHFRSRLCRRNIFLVKCAALILPTPLPNCAFVGGVVTRQRPAHHRLPAQKLENPSCHVLCEFSHLSPDTVLLSAGAAALRPSGMWAGGAGPTNRRRHRMPAQSLVHCPKQNRPDSGHSGAS